MKRNILLALIIGLLAFIVSAQKIGKPKLEPVSPTPAQEKLILEGIRLHDEKKYDDAIKIYQDVLKESPDCALAIYEMALSYYNKKDFDNAKETAFKLVQYKGKHGYLGYGIFANILDDEGKPQDAIKIYQRAIKEFKGDSEYTEHLSNLYYNLGVTYTRQKKYKEAREVLKDAVVTNFSYKSPHALLGEVFYGTKYKISAFLAMSRFLPLEINSGRSKRATKVILDILKPAEKDKKGNINIFLDFNAPTDEGDFGAVELFLGTLTAIETEENKNKSKNERFADGVETLIALVEETKGIDKTFVGKTYLPFMSEMKKKGYVKYFAYLVLQQNGDKDAEKWLVDQGQKTIDFLNWARKYQLKN